MSILKALLWRRIAKIWKDGKSTAWLLSCRPAALLPAYREAQVPLKRKTGMVSSFPLCMNRQLSDTGTVKYELKATVKKKIKETYETPCHAHSLPVLSSPSHTHFSSVWSNTGTGFLKGWLVPYACSRDFWATPSICFNFWLVLKCSGSWIRWSLMVLSRWIFHPVLFYSRNILLFYSRSILETP